MASEFARQQASVRRVPVPHAGKISGVLVPRPMAFLAVALVLDDHPVLGLPVAFFQCDADGEKDKALGDPVPSDDQGVARLPRLVPSGNYLCEVEGQETAAIVTTVNGLHDAATLYLPIGSESVGVHWEDAIIDESIDAETA